MDAVNTDSLMVSTLASIGYTGCPSTGFVSSHDPGIPETYSPGIIYVDSCYVNQPVDLGSGTTCAGKNQFTNRLCSCKSIGNFLLTNFEK